MTNGQEAEFTYLVHQYGEKLYWHIRSMSVSHEDADDILQNVFLKAWNSFPSFRGDSAGFTWLWRIACNETFSFLRREKIRSIFGRIDSASRISSDPYFNGDEAEARLRTAIAELPPKQRAVFCMRYYEELPFEKISDITGTSVGALKTSFHIAQKKIKNSII